jgi:hypothetical protein
MVIPPTVVMCPYVPIWISTIYPRKELLSVSTEPRSLFRLCSARTPKIPETVDKRWNMKAQLNASFREKPQVKTTLRSEPGLQTDSLRAVEHLGPRAWADQYSASVIYFAGRTVPDDVPDEVREA